MPVSAPSSLAFELDLDAYAGPFDLLLALVLRDGIELVDVPVAEICVAYLERLADDEELDLEAASEFLVLVAALCELKARGLPPVEDEAEEPLDAELAAAELAGRLAEYARVQAAAGWLAARRAEVGQLLFRSGPPALRPPRPEEHAPVGSGDPAALRAALATLLEPPRARLAVAPAASQPARAPVPAAPAAPARRARHLHLRGGRRATSTARSRRSPSGRCWSCTAAARRASGSGAVRPYPRRPDRRRHALAPGARRADAARRRGRAEADDAEAVA